jgi:peptide/nickel transport system permease protein
VALQFLGFANNQEISWGTILYWAQNSSAVETGAWWTYLFAGSAIALVATALALINFGIDTISNPRLRTERVKVPRAGQTVSTAVVEGTAFS